MTKTELFEVETKRRLEDMQQYRWSKHVSLCTFLRFLQFETFTIDELQPPGEYGIRGMASEGSAARAALKKSLLDYPVEVIPEAI